MHTFQAESHAALDAASILTFIGRWIPGSSPRMTTERLITELMRPPHEDFGPDKAGLNNVIRSRN